MTALGLIRSLWRNETPRASSDTPEELLECLDSAVALRDRLAEKVADSIDREPLANAASICRWEIMLLRDRVAALNLPRAHQAAHTQVLRQLDEAANAARQLSSGYRYTSLDRICDGGQALDDRLEALAQLRERLAS
jgi:hypothetical protein